MYRLGHQTPEVDAAWAALPPEASEELTLAMAEVCRDPWRATAPLDADDEKDVRRKLVLRHVTVNLLIVDAPPIQRVYIRIIEPLD